MMMNGLFKGHMLWNKKILATTSPNSNKLNFRQYLNFDAKMKPSLPSKLCEILNQLGIYTKSTSPQFS